MSESTSASLPPSNPISGNDAGSTEFYDGADAVEQAWLGGLEPDPFLTISEWSDRYRYLSPKSAAEPGRWRTERTPYLREIMDMLSSHEPVQRVIFMKGAQIGGTEAGNNWIGYVIHMAPGPMMAVAPTVEMAKRNSKQRIDPLLEDSKELKARVKPSRSRDSGNTVLSKEFPGGVLVMTGANSAVGLRSMPARYLFMDEVDGYPGDVEGEGDPILLAERRSATCQGRRKVLLVSTPTIKGVSRIAREFEQSDQRYFHVPCPHCDHMQPLRFCQRRWIDGQPKDVVYECESCEEHIAEHHKTAMLAAGRWVASKEGDGRTVGYHLSSLYSPVGWFSWSEAAHMFEQAGEHPELMKSFVNTVLGEPFEEEHEAPDWHRLYERRETYTENTIPKGGLFLTAGVDVQKDRLECEIVAWGRNKESWSVGYEVIAGDTARREVWQELEKLLNRDWLHETGHTMPIRVMAVDSGYATQDVYGWVKGHPQAVWGAGGARASQPRTVVAIKGQDRDTALILSVSKADVGGRRRGLRVWNVSGPVAKVELYRWLKLDWPTEKELELGETYPAGSCHFPQYGEEYFKQLTAEKRIIRIHKGYPRAVWEKDPTRNNEALDCRVYARAAASIYGLDRFMERHWLQLEESLGKPVPTAPVVDQPQVSEPVHLSDRLKQRPVQMADDPYL
ncbi:phage terminase large subunit family protein [Emcibacteraceae bacterium Y4]|uniref:phage terminase large subunit family protein n=1 Tax=Pseudemcibacter aquimaris TaxID=2857064 RepID=UPI002011B23E|nr:phage terminase large subunit family protein [Pseudemcibacter aquimaris]MCC3862633.1 phage terminase large subunit family protein [Pseudemcibacter aquimaris]